MSGSRGAPCRWLDGCGPLLKRRVIRTGVWGGRMDAIKRRGVHRPLQGRGHPDTPNRPQIMNLVVDLGQGEDSVEVKEVGRGHTNLKSWCPPALGSHYVAGPFPREGLKATLSCISTSTWQLVSVLPSNLTQMTFGSQLSQ